MTPFKEIQPFVSLCISDLSQRQQSAEDVLTIPGISGWVTDSVLRGRLILLFKLNCYGKCGLDIIAHQLTSFLMLL